MDKGFKIVHGLSKKQYKELKPYTLVIKILDDGYALLYVDRAGKHTYKGKKCEMLWDSDSDRLFVIGTYYNASTYMEDFIDDFREANLSYKSLSDVEAVSAALNLNGYSDKASWQGVNSRVFVKTVHGVANNAIDSTAISVIDEFISLHDFVNIISTSTSTCTRLVGASFCSAVTVTITYEF